MIKNPGIREDSRKFSFEVSSQAVASAESAVHSTWYNSLFTETYSLLSYLPKFPGSHNLFVTLQ